MKFDLHMPRSGQTHGAWLTDHAGTRGPRTCLAHWINTRDGFVIGIYDNVNRPAQIRGGGSGCDIALQFLGGVIKIHRIADGILTTIQVDEKVYEKEVRLFLDAVLTRSAAKEAQPLGRTPDGASERTAGIINQIRGSQPAVMTDRQRAFNSLGAAAHKSMRALCNDHLWKDLVDGRADFNDHFEVLEERVTRFRDRRALPIEKTCTPVVSDRSLTLAKMGDVEFLLDLVANRQEHLLNEEIARLALIADRLKANPEGEAERLRMQLSCCSVLAKADTRESHSKATTGVHPDYWSATAADVRDLAMTVIELREELAGRPHFENLPSTLIQAIARGWCHQPNDVKVMDPDLASAIAAEVFAALTGKKYEEAMSRLRELKMAPPAEPAQVGSKMYRLQAAITNIETAARADALGGAANLAVVRARLVDLVSQWADISEPANEVEARERDPGHEQGQVVDLDADIAARAADRAANLIVWNGLTVSRQREASGLLTAREATDVLNGDVNIKTLLTFPVDGSALIRCQPSDASTGTGTINAFLALPTPVRDAILAAADPLERRQIQAGEQFWGHFFTVEAVEGVASTVTRKLTGVKTAVRAAPERWPLVNREVVTAKDRNLVRADKVSTPRPAAVDAEMPE